MNRLILLEGLPGTGKTTNSYRLYEQLVRNGREVRWLHEVSQPHPTLFFSEACLTREEYRLFTEKHPEAADMLAGIAEIRASTVGIDYLTAARKLPGQESAAWVRELLRHDVMGFPLERYEPVAQEKWEAFARAALQEDAIYIMDGSVFQYQIFTYLLNGAEYPRLAICTGKRPGIPSRSSKSSAASGPWNPPGNGIRGGPTIGTNSRT